MRWTKSPEDEANYADWKIQVRYYPITSSSSKSDDNNERGDPSNKENTTAAVTETTDVVTYSVHRSSLGLKSEHFESIFLGGFSESSERHSKILPAPVVTLEHFETVLEYCYTGKVNLNCINAISITYLSDYLGMEELKEQAQGFTRKWINKDNKEGLLSICSEKSQSLATYYQEAKILAMEDIQKVIVHVCRKEPGIMKKDFALAEIPDVEFWCRLWEARKLHPDQKSSKDTISSCGVKMWLILSISTLILSTLNSFAHSPTSTPCQSFW